MRNLNFLITLAVLCFGTVLALPTAVSTGILKDTTSLSCRFEIPASSHSATDRDAAVLCANDPNRSYIDIPEALKPVVRLQARKKSKTKTKSKGKGKGPGGKGYWWIGVLIGGIVLIILVTLLVIWLLRRRRAARLRDPPAVVDPVVAEVKV